MSGFYIPWWLRAAIAALEAPGRAAAVVKRALKR